jgi:uncharacterized glyoxalase superfamily protein PhnB
MSKGEFSIGGACNRLGEFRFLFYAGDFDAAVAFYQNGLGLKVFEQWNRAPDDRGIVFRAASGMIEILCCAEHAGTPCGSSLLIEVEDVDEFYQQLCNKHVPIKEELLNTPWGHRRFIVSDPDGNDLSFFSIIR